jgi:aminoglycoside 2''-phosphotransferase
VEQVFHLYLQSIRATYPDLRIESVHARQREGQFNDILVVNGEIIFRFPRYPAGIRSLAGEVLILRRLRGHVTLPIPDPIYTSQDGQTIGKIFMGYRMIPGEPLWRETLDDIDDDETLQRLAAQLAGFLAGLHALPAESVGADLPIYDRPDEWAKMYADIRRHLFPLMRSDARDRVRRHFEAFLNEPRLHTFKPALRHGDFGPSNILYDPNARMIGGIIDFSSAGLGDPAADIAAISCYGTSFFERVCGAYPQVEPMLERARFYRGTFALQEALHGFLNDDREAFESGIADYGPTRPRPEAARF